MMLDAELHRLATSHSLTLRSALPGSQASLIETDFASKIHSDIASNDLWSPHSRVVSH